MSDYNRPLLSTKPGSYALFVTLKSPIEILVGKLGQFVIPGGLYIYAGSAQGPGGLRARLTRHIYYQQGKKPHWHIDYLLPHGKPIAVASMFNSYDNDADASVYLNASHKNILHTPLECKISQHLASLPHASTPINGFGSSDCMHNCVTHLICFENLRLCENIQQTVESLFGQIQSLGARAELLYLSSSP